MKKIIGVMGPGEKQATKEDIECAFHVGKLVANTGWADGLLTIPAGHVDKGDQIREAAVKEVKEEACVDVEIADLEFVHVDYLRDEYTNFYFKAKKWEGEPKLGEPELASEALWIDKTAIPEDVTPQLRRLFKRMELREYFSEIEREDVI